jgi:acyl dehydratase
VSETKTSASGEGAEMDVLQEIEAQYGAVQYEEISEIPVERGYIWTSCASVENGNPLFWDEKAADSLTGGPIAAPTMVSVWFRPHHWAPGRTKQSLPLQVHFDLKERFELPEAVMTDNTIEFYEPVRIGDLLRTHQVLRSVSAPKTTKLGEGRFWIIDVVYRNQRDQLVAIETYTGFGYRRSSSPAAVSNAQPSPDGSHADAASATDGEGPKTAPVPSDAAVPRRLLADVKEGTSLPELRYEVSATTVVLGALATRDWRPMHHDKDFAVERNGIQNIFLNTPNQAAWFERFITDWTGPHGRLGKIRFRMSGSVFPGDTMVFSGVVENSTLGEDGCGWLDLALRLTVNGVVATTAAAHVAIPVDADDNPWARAPENWHPQAP